MLGRLESMFMVFCLTIMAVANIGVGFAFAVYLGRRYRDLMAGSCWAGLPSGLVSPLAGAMPESTPSDPSAGPSSADPAIGNSQKSARQAAIEDLRQRGDQFSTQLSDADAQLRKHASNPDAAEIEACLGGLETLAREYLEHRQGALRYFTDLMRNEPQWEEIHNDLEVAAQLQGAEIKATRQAIARFDYESDPGGACLQLARQTQRLTSTSDHLRDTLDRAMVDLARKEDRLNAPTESQGRDALTGCLSRTGVEAALAALWDADPERDGRLCAAILDVDQLSRVNEQFGYLAGNEILRQIGQLLQAEPQDNIAVSRFAGQQFLLVFSDISLQEVIVTIERTRQTIEKAHFGYRDSEIRLTLSCAVGVAMAHDAPMAVVNRAQAALREAKRYGHNRTFTHEGKYPSPVVPPDLQVEEKRIPLLQG